MPDARKRSWLRLLALQLGALQLIALLGGGCGPAPALEVSRFSAGITDGLPDEGHPAVGLLLVYDEQGEPLGQCTGSLVGPTTVLTAAHCLLPAGRQVFVLGEQRLAAWRAVQHPSFDPALPVIPPDHDIGLVRLEQAPAVAPVALNPWAPVAGSEVTLVGFGVTGEGQHDGGSKRVATNEIREVTDSRFSFASAGEEIGSICYGDSGGPAFAVLEGQQLQIGVASAIDGLCGVGVAWEIRVDRYLEWLLEAAGEPLVVAQAQQLAPPVPALAEAPSSASSPLPLEPVDYVEDSDSAGPPAAGGGCHLAPQQPGPGEPLQLLPLLLLGALVLRRGAVRDGEPDRPGP